VDVPKIFAAEPERNLIHNGARINLSEYIDVKVRLRREGWHFMKFFIESD